MVLMFISYMNLYIKNNFFLYVVFFFTFVIILDFYEQYFVCTAKNFDVYLGKRFLKIFYTNAFTAIINDFNCKQVVNTNF